MKPELKESTPGGYREVWHIAWPLIVSTGSFTLMQFVDRVFLANYSSVSIQAALPAGILSFTMICFFMAVAGYANTLVAQYHGANQPESCSRSVAQAVWLSIFSIPVLALLVPVGRWLIVLSDHPPAVTKEELEYFTILTAGGFLVVVNSAISSFFTGRGETFTNMIAVVAGNLLNIPLDYMMIFGKWGCPELGIEGAAIATVISSAATPLILGILYFSRRNHATHRTRAHLRFDPALFRRLLRFGFPSGVNFFLDVASFSVFVMLIGRMGEVALAVSNIALSINMVAFMPLLGISIAATTLVGQYQGAGDHATAERAGWNALKIATGYMAAIGLTYVLFPALWFELFAQRDGGGLSLDQLMETGRWLLVMMAAWGIFDAANVVLSGALKGAGDTKFVMYFAIIGGWLLLVPAELVLVLYYKCSVLTAWLVLCLYVVFLAAGYWLRFRAGRWKEIKVIEHETPTIPPRGSDDFIVNG